MNKYLKLLSAHKVATGIVIGIILGIVGPIVINQLYTHGKIYGGYVTLWDAADLLQYYGTLLGASATIIAVTWTIKFTRESAEEDRKMSKNNSFRDHGIKLCFELIEIVSYKNIIDIINKHKIDEFSSAKKYNEAIVNEISNLDRCILERFIKFYTFHPFLSDIKKAEIVNAEDGCYKILDELKKIFTISFEEETLEETSKRVDKKFNKVNYEFKKLNENNFKLYDLIQEVIFKYDYSLKNEDAKKDNKNSEDN